MNYNAVIEREKSFIDKICDNYNYDSNIRHLLYLIIPAFIIKYGTNKERLILNTFEDIRIVISNKKDNYVKAFYSSKIIHVNDQYKTLKYMVIQNYEKISLIDLLDNLVHEFNHAINSAVNEIKVTKNYIYLRTGLTFRIYSKDSLNFVKKDSSYLLEEIINTKQTEEIINIIKQFDNLDKSLDNTVYAINAETSHKYNSNSYFLESYVCKQILENRTFINTLANLRINGEVYDIQKWFDDIIGKDGTYKELIKLLNDIYNLEMEYSKKKAFRMFIIRKIDNVFHKIMNIVETFNNNVNFK